MMMNNQPAQGGNSGLNHLQGMPQQHSQGLQAMQSNVNGASNGVGGNGAGSQGDAASSAPPDYTLAGILHYLQSEWRRYEKDRNEWEIERAEMRARIALLEGERRSTENLRNDLMRRIKMLEYALRQERTKFLANAAPNAHGGPLRNPALQNLEKDSNQSASGRSSPALPDVSESNAAAHARPASVLSNHNLNLPTLATQNSSLNLAALAGGPSGGSSASVNGLRSAKDTRSREKSRDYLRQCLQEISYLTSTATLNPLGERPTGSLLHGVTQAPTRPRKTLHESVPTSGFGQPEDDNVPSEASTTASDNIPFEAEVRPPSPQPYVTHGNLPSEHSETSHSGISGQSKREVGAAALDSDQKAVPSTGSNQANLPLHAQAENHSAKIEEMMRTSHESAFRHASGDEAGSFVEDAQDWKVQTVLALHRSPVRAIAFDTTGLRIFSGSNDRSVKSVNLLPSGDTGKVVSSLKSTRLEATEAILSGHTGPVTSLTVSASKRILYSGSLDKSIRLWGLDSGSDIQSLPPQSLSNIQTPSEITQLALLPTSSGIEAVLATASVDGMIRLYTIGDARESELSSLTLHKEFDYFGCQPAAPSGAIQEESEIHRQTLGGLPVPTFICHLPSAMGACAVSFSNAIVKVFDISTGQELTESADSSFGILSPIKLDQSFDGTSGTQINAVVAHPTLPLLLTAHEDKFIRVCELPGHLPAVSGAAKAPQLILSMHAHSDAVTSLDIDPAGLKLLSVGNDGTARIWDLFHLTERFTDKGNVAEADSAANDTDVAIPTRTPPEDDDDDEPALTLVQEINESNLKVRSGNSAQNGAGRLLAAKYHRSRPVFAVATAGGTVKLFG